PEEELAVHLGGKTAGDPPPEDPPLGPVGLLGGVLHALLEEFGELLHAPGVEGGAVTGSEEVAGELEEDALVVKGAPPPPCAPEDHAPELAVDGRAPGVARAEHLLQIAPELLDLAGVDVFGAGAVGALDQGAGFVEAGGERLDGRDLGAAAHVAAQRELEPPPPRRRLQALEVEFEGTDLGEGGGDAHRKHAVALPG